MLPVKHDNRISFGSTETYRIQKTLAAPVTLAGVGIHTGKQSRITLKPAPVNHGLIFSKVGTKKVIPAHFSSVVSTSLATTVGHADDPESRIFTIEHVLSALFGMGITNVLLEVEGPEIPILDGSAAPFVEAISEVGIVAQPYTAPILKILKPIKVYENDAICELLPRESMRLTTSIDFPHPKIGLQTFALELTPQSFAEQVSRARTFGFLRDLDKLRKLNLALGASVENVLAFSEDGILNAEGMRYANECVRHKLLDAVGDLALCGSWIEGEMVSYRGGHSMHLNLLKALSQQPQHWKLLPAEPVMSGNRLKTATALSFDAVMLDS